MPCAHAESQLAASALEDVWLFAGPGAARPSSCLLLPQRDVHFQHNAMRQVVAKAKPSGMFRCRGCQKTFKTSAYLDQHISRKHPPSSAGDVCFADFCAFLPCHAYPALPEFHPARVRAEHLCLTAMHTCFSTDPAYFDLVDLVCYQRAGVVFRPRFEAEKGFALVTIASWFAMALVACFYLFQLGRAGSRYLALADPNRSLLAKLRRRN